MRALTFVVVATLALTASAVPRDYLRGEMMSFEETGHRDPRNLICENCMEELQYQVLGLRCATNFYDNDCVHSLLSKVKADYCPRCRSKVDAGRIPYPPMSNCLPCTYSCREVPRAAPDGKVSFRPYYRYFWQGLMTEHEGWLSFENPFACCREPSPSSVRTDVTEDYKGKLLEFMKECEAYDPAPADEVRDFVTVPSVNADQCMDLRQVHVGTGLDEAKLSTSDCNGPFKNVDFSGWGRFTSAAAPRERINNACLFCQSNSCPLVKNKIKTGLVTAEEVKNIDIPDCMEACNSDCVPRKCWYGGDPPDKLFKSSRAKVAWVQAHMFVSQRGEQCPEDPTGEGA